MQNILTILIVGITINTFAQQSIYTIKDLTNFSKNQYGFVKSDGTINEHYGDIDCISVGKNIFEFNVGCGKCGDVVGLLIKKNEKESNTFLLYSNVVRPEINNKLIGTITIINEQFLIGKINFCFEKGECCCGEEGINFLLQKIN